MARRHAKARHKPKEVSVGVINIAQRGYGFVSTPEGEFFVQKGNLHGAMDGDLVEIARLKRLESHLQNQANQRQSKAKTLGSKSDGTRDKSGRLQMQGSVLRVLERAHQTVIGILHYVKGLGIVVPDDRRLNFDIFLDLRAISKPAKEGDVVVVRLSVYPSRRESAQGYIEEVLGHSSEQGLEIDVIIRKYDLPTSFSAETLKQAQQLENIPITEFSNLESIKSVVEFPELERRDLRKRDIFTIDPADAKDYDDAISLDKIDGKLRLGVHIADVSALVAWDSPIDIDARRRTTSVYLPDRVIPMLPISLSDGLCSLQPGQDRLAFTVDLILAKDGSLLSSEFYPSLINSTHRLTYAEVQAALDGQAVYQIDKTLLGKLQTLAMLAKRLVKKRQQNGALDFDSTEPKVKLDQNGQPLSVELKRKNDATSLIEEAMILANEAVAYHMLSLEAPMIYRVHEQPLQSALDEMLPTLQELGLAQKQAPANSREIQEVLQESRNIGAYELISSLLLRAMKRAHYAQNFTTHFGLASDAYTHFTSPIRRYPDLMAHRLLKLHLLAKEDLNINRQLAWISEHCSDGEYLADKASQEALKQKLCVYMAGQIGTDYMAVISGVNSYGFFVKELITYTEGFVASDSLAGDYVYESERQRWYDSGTLKTLRLGQSIRVKLVNVEVEKLLIEFIVM